MQMPDNIKYLTTLSTHQIAYHYSRGNQPTVVFIHGFGSSMQGDKAVAMEEACRRWGHAFIRFDLSGCGQSSGDFSSATIDRWLADAIAVIDKLTQGPLILVGSSMGGWLMVLIAQARQERIIHCVGLASAPDMTDYTLTSKFNRDQCEALEKEGLIMIHNPDFDDPMIIYKLLLDSGKKHNVLKAPIMLNIPLNLIHARDDKDVPWQRSQILHEQWHGAPSELLLLPQGGHRLSDNKSLSVIINQLRIILDNHCR